MASAAEGVAAPERLRTTALDHAGARLFCIVFEIRLYY